MPLYEYRCESCGTTVEGLFKLDDSPPVCHGTMIKVPSRRPGHRLTGDPERARVGKMISTFHRDYLNSRAGREQLHDDKRGHMDLGAVADAVTAQQRGE